jgi:threonine aldolase
VGSLVCGTRDFIAEARRARKVLGGGMRQAGVLAAAGIVALDEMVDRLAQDHANARRLVDGLSNIGKLSVHPERVKTNILYIELDQQGRTALEVAENLAGHGVRLLPTAAYQLRAVTHLHITAEDVDRAVEVMAKALA